MLLLDDIDECEERLHNCTGIAKCVNERGFFRCTCPDGYALNKNFSGCDGE